MKHNIAFIVEQALGHITYGKNLEIAVPKDPEINPYWGFPAWETDGIAGKIPLYNSNWTVRAGWRARGHLRRIAKQTKLDGIFFHTQVTAVLSPDWLKRIPGIVSLDATPLQYDEFGAAYDHETGSGWLESAKFKLNQRCYNLAKHLVVWAAWTKRSLVDDYGVSPDKITVVHPGVQTAQWHNPNPRSFHNSNVKILFVGGNLDRKGGQLLLEAVRILRQESLVAQNGSVKPVQVELHLVTRDHVVPEPGVFVYNNLKPNTPELKEMYYTSDIFCLPTYGDSMPLVLSEAGAAGLPVVSTGIAAIPEIVRDGETGHIVPMGDIRALTEALRHLVQNPDIRQAQSKRAVEVISQTFDSERNTQQLLAKIKDVVRQ
jgi:glycosyltransferase involved in cell wall biosynthesis